MVGQEAMDDRRKYPRMRTLKSGKILLGKRGIPIPCIIRNLSECGSCLEFQSTYGLPATFDFVMPDHAPRHCKVAWLDAAKMGVQFQ
jgi:hypothetical protein